MKAKDFCGVGISATVISTFFLLHHLSLKVERWSYFGFRVRV